MKLILTSPRKEATEVASPDFFDSPKRESKKRKPPELPLSGHYKRIHSTDPYPAMADQASKDAAAKQRIITHMNNDHQDSLIRYLEHFHALSSFSARNARLTDITFSSLTIVSSEGGKPYRIHIKPEMTSWSEARPRVVALDAEAVSGLNRSNITVKRYVPPYGFMTAIFIACACTFLAFSRRANFEPRSLLYDLLLAYIPRFADFCWKIQPLLFLPMILLHTIEAQHMARTRLAKHSVPIISQLYWTWVASTFVEGFGAFKRFDDVVKEEERKKANAKH